VSEEEEDMSRVLLRAPSLLAVLACAAIAGALVYAQQTSVKKDVPYVPTPETVVDAMLKMAEVGKTDVVYDLGCGDGRIVIAAAQKYGARGVGYDIDPERIKESNENAKKAGVSDRVKFAVQDLFEADFREATVVTLYLLPQVNLRLRPKLLAELKPGTRIVSHAFDMGDWKPDKTAEVDGRTIYFWVVPEKKP
jgi:SAM-dependent methyltransferase